MLTISDTVTALSTTVVKDVNEKVYRTLSCAEIHSQCYAHSLCGQVISSNVNIVSSRVTRLILKG